MRRSRDSRRSLWPAPMILGLTLAALAVVVSGAPVLAGSVAPNYGSTVTCNYRTNSPGPAFNANVRKIIVTAPKVFAKSGHQTVGWRFSVWRTIDEGDHPSHKVTYRSPIQRATATTTRAAVFNTKSVGVALPNVEELRNVSYQVVIRMIWYRANGSVQSATSYLMPTYTVHVQGHGWKYTEDDHSVCEAVQWAAV